MNWYFKKYIFNVEKDRQDLEIRENIRINFVLFHFHFICPLSAILLLLKDLGAKSQSSD